MYFTAILGTLLLVVNLSQVSTGDTFNEKPSDEKEPDQEESEDDLYTPFGDVTDVTQFNDSGVIEQFNKNYLHLMLARSAALAMANLKECKDKEKRCSQWAKDGYCYTNAGYMSVACKRSCDVCDLSVCEDNHQRCEEWAGKGECSKRAQYMVVTCRKSCG